MSTRPPWRGSRRRPGRARLPRSVARQQAQAGPQAHRGFDQEAARRDRRSTRRCRRRRRAAARARSGATSTPSWTRWAPRSTSRASRTRSSRSPRATASARASPTRRGATSASGRRAQAGRHRPQRPSAARASSSAAATRSRWRSERCRSNASSRADRVERHLGIVLEQLTEIGACLPRRHRVALHDPIGVVAGQPGGHEREQHRLAEHQAVARPQVLAHPLGVDLQAPRATDCSRLHARSGRAVTSRAGRSARPRSARCRARATARRPAVRPAGCERTTRARPLIVSAEIGLRLCGIADEPFWPGLKPSCTSRDLGALEVAQLDGDQLARRSRPTRTPTGTRRDGRGRSPGSPAPGAARARSPTNCSTAGSMLEYVPTAPRQLAHRDGLAGRAAAGSRSRSICSAHSATLAPNVVGSAWMPCVRPIITVSRWRAGQLDERGEQLRRRRRSADVGGVAHRPAQRGVDDVGRRQAVVDPRAGRRADALLDDVDERGDVVVGDRARARRRRRRTRRRRPAPARGRPRRRRPARRRARRGPRWPAARPPASGRSGSVSAQTAAISGSE